jgi:uncharacterized protein YxjI
MSKTTPMNADPPPLDLVAQSELTVVQRRETAEMFGIETRNKYEVRGADGRVLAFVAEQGKGVSDALSRMFLGHWRTFDLQVFDASRRPVMVARHPFRWFLKRLELSTPEGRPLGVIQQRWGVLRRRFDLLDANGRLSLTMDASIFAPWTFPILRAGAAVACIEKRWGGVLKESFTDADTFRVTFTPGVSAAERAVLLATAIFVDLKYFEKRAGGR